MTHVASSRGSLGQIGLGAYTLSNGDKLIAFGLRIVDHPRQNLCTVFRII